MDGPPQRPADEAGPITAPFVPPPPPGMVDESCAQGLLVVMWLFWSLTTIILCLRLYAAVAYVNRLRASEYLMMIAYVRVIPPTHPFSLPFPHPGTRSTPGLIRASNPPT
jgi:hypothetical protein